jgi:hypothetical protein
VDRKQLKEQLDIVEAELLKPSGKYKLLRRRQNLHRYGITGPQADQMRNFLHGRKVDAARLVDFEPSDFIDRNGDLDIGALLWWLDTWEIGRWS